MQHKTDYPFFYAANLSIHHSRHWMFVLKAERGREYRILSALTRIAGHFVRHLYFFDQNKAGLKRSEPQTGAITLIQRFGSAANRNIHPYCLGTPDTQQGRAEPAPAKTGVVLTLKTPYRDGTTHIVLSPLEFMQRLVALIPRSRSDLIRFASFRFAKYLLAPFHGVLAPNAQTAR